LDAFVSGRRVVVEERDFPTEECGEHANTGKWLSPTAKVCETLGCAIAKTVWISMSHSIDSKSRWSFGEGQRRVDFGQSLISVTTVALGLVTGLVVSSRAAD
jgi:hypothetical protein